MKTTIDCIAWNLTNESFSNIKNKTPVIGPKTYASAPEVSFLSPVTVLLLP